MININKIIKLHLTFLFVASLMLALPAPASKFKALIAPGSLSTLLNDANSAELEGVLDGTAVDFDSKEGTTGVSFAIDIGKGPNKFAIDYYSVTSIYKYSGSFNTVISDGNGGAIPVTFNSEVESTFGATGLMLGYRYHASSGFYIGGGIMSINPSIDIKIDTTATATNSGASVSTSASDTSNYDRIMPLTLPLGYDHSYDNGLV